MALELLNKTELAWAAGFYDGEGCTVNRGNFQPSMTITQADPYVLERFAKAVGVGKVYGPYSRANNPKHSPNWSYQSGTFEKTQHCLAQLWTWLSPQKKQQAIRRFIEYRNKVDKRRKVQVGHIAS
jgi:hypothetical protein